MDIADIAVADSHMVTIVQRVHFLRARAQKQRWSEELILVGYEMSWTVRYYRRQAEIWKQRSTETPVPGPIAYARRKVDMWGEIAWFAEESFKKKKSTYRPIVM